MRDPKIQYQADIDEAVDAYFHGGQKLAALTFRAIAGARKLTRAEAVIMGDHIRARLTQLGYLPINGGSTQ